MKKKKITTNTIPYTKHIPVQGNITKPLLDKKTGTTISTDDADIMDITNNRYEQDEIADQLNANVTKDERKLLDDAAIKINSTDQTALENAKPDQYDDDGELLNEKTGLSGNDLDVPGSELDNANEKIGEEDEENNSYSMDDEHEDNNNTRQ